MDCANFIIIYVYFDVWTSCIDIFIINLKLHFTDQNVTLLKLSNPLLTIFLHSCKAQPDFIMLIIKMQLFQIGITFRTVY